MITCTIGDLGLSGIWVYLGFCYRGKCNRRVGRVGDLGLSGVLLSGSFFYRGKGYRGLGLSGKRRAPDYYIIITLSF